jgi:transcriptional regulator with XRE-family HTH domain
MRGYEVKQLREGLGLNAYAFAEILGVHVSTLYRWEQARGQVNMDLLQARILERLAEQLQVKKEAEQKQLGEDLKNALLVGGALVALALLLSKIK